MRRFNFRNIRMAGLALGGALTFASMSSQALVIVPTFDSTITGGASITGVIASNANPVESAIDSAIATLDSLYANSGSVGIVFNEASGSFLGESQTADYSMTYSAYTSLLSTNAAHNPTNTTLSTAVANLSSGNKPGSTGSVILTSADARVALGVFGATGCYSSAGTYVSACGQADDGTVTLSSSYTLNYGTTPVAGEYSAISVLEHEIDEILGGGGQGTVLNAVAAGTSWVANSVGVLDLYRYSAPGVTSFTTSGSASSYLSVNGGVTSIVGFNQNSNGDFGDFSTCNNVQSAFGCSGLVPAYTTASPEYQMMEAIGYDGVAAVPEPSSLALVGGGLALWRLLRRRARAPIYS